MFRSFFKVRPDLFSHEFAKLTKQLRHVHESVSNVTRTDHKFHHFCQNQEIRSRLNCKVSVVSSRLSPKASDTPPHMLKYM